MEIGGEGLSLAKLAVFAIILFGVIALCVFIYTTFKGRTESTLDDMSNMLDSAAYAEFSAFDNQIVSGSEIQSAANLYKGREYMIAVITAGTGNTYYSQDSGTMLSGKQYYYNAVPDGINSNNGVYSGNAITQENGVYSIEQLQRDPDTGMAVQNSNYSPMARKTTPETYVKSNGRYYANIVVDSNGEIAGFLFQQMQ